MGFTPFKQEDQHAAKIGRKMFSEKSLAEIWSNYRAVHQKYETLTMRYAMLELENQRAREFAKQGFPRRLRIMVQCINNVFAILPPEREDVPATEEILNATINIQAFMVNVFGSIDNLAWIWVQERNLMMPNGKPIPYINIGLTSKNVRVRESFSPEFQEYLKTIDSWFDGMGDYRNALAHRISLYIPPYIISTDNHAAYQDLGARMNAALMCKDFAEYDRLSSEQDKLGKFRAWMFHSIEEEAPPIYFHPQILADFNTIEDIGLRMLDELKR
jgi:hypothetical protein